MEQDVRPRPLLLEGKSKSLPTVLPTVGAMDQLTLNCAGPLPGFPGKERDLVPCSTLSGLQEAPAADLRHLPAWSELTSTGFDFRYTPYQCPRCVRATGVDLYLLLVSYLLLLVSP